jgi:DNA end-binding protein Ku
MARARKESRSKPKKPKSTDLPFHAFWSGSLSFGLVNVPVLLFPASRHAGIRPHLISPQGSLLERRFYCPRDGKEVAADEIVRGYELDDGSYVIVDDRELEAIEPEKTREIDLRQFVDLAELPPMLLERGYYLTPRKDATKAYRLLAEAMERTNRAGIATFVMREREYLVAIFAQTGILCALTLRFHDEIREPESIGLPAPAVAPRRRVAAFERSLDALFTKTLSRNELADKEAQALGAIIEKKRRTRRDLVRTDHHPRDVDPDHDGDVDLLETIRRSLRSPETEPRARRPVAHPSPNGLRGKRKRTAAR